MMNVKVKHIKCDMSKKDKELMDKFIKLLQREYPLKGEVLISFQGERTGHMSTGSRSEEYGLKILTKGRLNRDILRTLAHEWVHEHQHSILKRERGQDIGGQNEDEANAFAGQLVKIFEKENPELIDQIYEGLQKINNKLESLNEQILIGQKETIQEGFINEMKKIGIDKLPYSYSALKQFVDPETMDIHYNKHYKGYVKKLNDALSNKKGEMELEDIIKSISKFDIKVRNNAGGAFNHALFWKMLSPKKQTPKGELVQKIIKQYGTFTKFKKEFNQIALDRFGSGWAWLILTKNNKLKVMSTPNQDNPLMNIVDGGGYPLLGLDLWEHAYYLRYKNKRDQYIKNFWNCVNWDFVNELYSLKTNTKEPLKEDVNHYIKSAFRLLNTKFNNLRPIEYKDSIWYVDEDSMPYFKLATNSSSSNIIYFNYKRIWILLEKLFKIQYADIRQILKEWLKTSYNLKDREPYIGILSRGLSWDRPIEG